MTFEEETAPWWMSNAHLRQKTRVIAGKGQARLRG